MAGIRPGPNRKVQFAEVDEGVGGDRDGRGVATGGGEVLAHGDDGEQADDADHHDGGFESSGR